ncbi:MAG: MgtC/SapB family protein [Sphingosinicella sp.]|uniref:MgtC/SapB family protein n=1 Tax=Sphingosinicella sp. TaxID=1917971 RepID=UPI004037D555
MFDHDPLAVFSWTELTLRLGTASLIGLLIGLDREITGHEAGIRTHALVALSSAMIMVSALMLAAQLRGEDYAPDPLRAVQGLSQAIGFIAAGVIFVRGANVVNMTTAANIWVAAAIGIAAGAGQYRLVLVGTGFGIALLTLVKLFERLLPRRDKSKQNPDD